MANLSEGIQCASFDTRRPMLDRATNILLQGLPKDIYTLINHYTDANDICDNEKMLLEGSELTKEDRESQLMMSSPNHPTSNIEDAFSLNFPDCLPASPDYVLASPGKTYSSSSNSFGIVLIASPSLLLFHDDLYMKVMHAYYAEKSPIPPSIITPRSSMPNPQEFFLPEEEFLLPEELLSPKKQGHDQSSSSTSTLPQAFEI
uniref:Integrase, catalytic region, zinc finger, CCHC-type, peptidase aspartic, catalytic n=1 Tax=Tanacetum cinerariifolium TaxID=118510 RepID=A0A699H156_TANCI|nr:integrase, catalytic region, zinc finger, CCHC-type, peptidase aspartic, catalytic [Tanacetum cinerariifolium]